MNKILADGIAILNAILAFVFIALGLFVGSAPGFWAQLTNRTDINPSDQAMGLVVGGGIGLLTAVLVCGLIALLVSINQHLKAIERSIKSLEERDRTRAA
jgi:uncharacterized membrane protein YraQ (UPF0718 family)